MKVVRFFLKRWKLFGTLGLLVALSPLVAIWIGRSVIAGSADGRIFEEAADVPECEVALVLGCARVLPDGRRNLYFKHRMAAVVKLWESGRVNYILVSGDNSRKDIDEPTT